MRRRLRREAGETTEGRRVLDGSSSPLVVVAAVMAIVDLRTTVPPEQWGVAIDSRSLARLAEEWRQRTFRPPSWDYPGLPIGLGVEEWCDYCGYAVSVLACLWPPEGEERWQAQLDPGGSGAWLDDASALFACFTRALDGGRLDPGRFLDWSADDVERFFVGRGTLQLLEARGLRLSAIARVMRERWPGGFPSLIEAADFRVEALVELLATRIPGYEDRVESSVGTLRFRKLASLAAAMMAAREPRLSGIETLTVYPDYMVPRVLRHHGVLRYAPRLAAAVDGRRPIAAGSTEELAIRWATVSAGARLCRELRDRGAEVDEARLDYALWSDAVLGREAARLGEHHRTLTLAY